MKVQILLILLFYISKFEAANILAVRPVTSRTQFSLSVILFNKLAENGHNVSNSN